MHGKQDSCATKYWHLLPSANASLDDSLRSGNPTGETKAACRRMKRDASQKAPMAGAHT